MKLRNILAAAALAAAAGVQAQPQYVVIENPQVDLSTVKVDKEGYYVLFDGTSLDGWRGYCKDHVPSKWNIKDGALHFDGRGPGEGGDIIFAHKFKDFLFEIEWKIAEGGNSGIFYLGKETATINNDAPKTEETKAGNVTITQTIDNRGKLNYQPIYISCPECQVLDNERHPDAKLGKDGNRMSSSLYDMIPAKPQNAKPAGQWNKVRVRVKDGHVQHFQNNVEVLSYDLWTPAWTALLQDSKFSEKSWPTAFDLLNNCGGPERKGFIGMQDHGDNVWYRNIKVKEL